MNDKKELRTTIRNLRKSITPTYRQQAEQQVADKLFATIKQLSPTQTANIGIYLAFGSELNLDAFTNQAIAQGFSLFAPYITKNSRLLHFTTYPNLNTHHTDHHGIMQYEDQLYELAKLDFLIMPLVGIDQQGYRLGQGGGYYDTTLNHKDDKTILIGVGFDCQLVEQVPRENHDMPVNIFISESKCLMFDMQ